MNWSGLIIWLSPQYLHAIDKCTMLQPWSLPRPRLFETQKQQAKQGLVALTTDALLHLVAKQSSFSYIFLYPYRPLPGLSCLCMAMPVLYRFRYISVWRECCLKNACIIDWLYVSIFCHWVKELFHICV
jgi:hypothetical protein